MAGPLLKVVTSRHDTDCGVCAIATITRVSYEEALLALGTEQPAILIGGAYVSDLKRAAKALGFSVRIYTRFSVTGRRIGILWVEGSLWKDEAHVVVLARGCIYDSDGEVFDAKTYLNAKKARPVRLLVFAEDR